MARKSAPVLDRPVQTKTKVCLHHWLIEPAEGPTSTGVCKLCGERKIFLNIVDDMEPKSSLGRFFEPDISLDTDTDENKDGDEGDDDQSDY